MRSHSHLSPDTGKRAPPYPQPSRQVIDLPTYPGGMEGRVYLGGCFYIFLKSLAIVNFGKVWQIKPTQPAFNLISNAL